MSKSLGSLDGFSYAERPSVLCNNPHDACEFSTVAQLLCVGFPAASSACIEHQLINPDVEDELHQLWHVLFFNL